MGTVKNKLELWKIIIPSLTAIVVALIPLYPSCNKTENKNKPDSAVSGVVVDANSGESLSGVEIISIGNNRQYITQSNGNFNLKSSFGETHVRLRFSKRNYETKDYEFDIPSPENIVQLNPTNNH